MNHAKIAAALHALAEAFEGAIEEVAPIKGKGKKATVEAAPAASAQVAQATAAAAPKA